MKKNECEWCGCCQDACKGNAGAFSRLWEVVSRLVTAGEKWVTQTDQEGRRVVFFDEGLYWEAKAALDCANQLCGKGGGCTDSGELDVGENPDPLVNERRLEAPPPPNETTTRGGPLLEMTAQKQALSKLNEAYRREGDAQEVLYKSREVLAETEKVIEVARRAVVKAEAAHDIAVGVLRASEQLPKAEQEAWEAVCAAKVAGVKVYLAVSEAAKELARDAKF